MDTILSPKNNLTQDSEENEENRIPSSRLQQNKDKQCQGTQQCPQEHPKEEILQVITANFMEILLDMVKQNVQKALKKLQDTKNKEYEKTQKQINELIRALNKHQSETENTINREINELKTKIDNIKEEVIHDMENLRKKE
jgi:uncharacterized protein YlxW (UPF0749 family)